MTAVDELWSRVAPTLNAANVPVWKNFSPYPVKGTGETYVVIRQGDGGMQPSRYHVGLSRPAIWLSIFSDSDRDEQGRATAHNSEAKALAVEEALRPLLQGQTWGSVVGCFLRDEPQLLSEPDSDYEACLLSCVYQVDLNSESLVQ